MLHHCNRVAYCSARFALSIESYIYWNESSVVIFLVEEFSFSYSGHSN